jgi:hypothetical protein
VGEHDTLRAAGAATGEEEDVRVALVDDWDVPTVTHADLFAAADRASTDDVVVPELS